MPSTFSRKAATAAAVLVGFLLAGPVAQAQVTAFSVFGAGTVDAFPAAPGPQNAERHWAVGAATDVGPYYGETQVQLLSLDLATLSGTFQSKKPFPFTSLVDGDTLAFHYGRVDKGASAPGVVTLIPTTDGKFISVWWAEFTYDHAKSSGRFKKLKGGSFWMLAITAPFVPTDTNVPYAWWGAGSIEY